MAGVGFGFRTDAFRGVEFVWSLSSFRSFFCCCGEDTGHGGVVAVLLQAFWFVDEWLLACFRLAGLCED